MDEENSHDILNSMAVKSVEGITEKWPDSSKILNVGEVVIHAVHKVRRLS